jgi:hypothetical protein
MTVNGVDHVLIAMPSGGLLAASDAGFSPREAAPPSGDGA